VPSMRVSTTSPLGLTLDGSVNGQLVVKSVDCSDGIATVASYDRIVSVNGQTGGSKLLECIIQNNEDASLPMNIDLERPAIIQVKSSGDLKLGATITFTELSLGCIIEEIYDGGLLSTYNASNTHQLLKSMDRIIAVNDQRLPAPKLYRMLRKMRVTSLELLCYPEQKWTRSNTSESLRSPGSITDGPRGSTASRRSSYSFAGPDEEEAWGPMVTNAGDGRASRQGRHTRRPSHLVR